MKVPTLPSTYGRSFYLFIYMNMPQRWFQNFRTIDSGASNCLGSSRNTIYEVWTSSKLLSKISKGKVPKNAPVPFSSQHAF